MTQFFSSRSRRNCRGVTPSKCASSSEYIAACCGAVNDSRGTTRPVMAPATAGATVNTSATDIDASLRGRGDGGRARVFQLQPHRVGTLVRLERGANEPAQERQVRPPLHRPRQVGFDQLAQAAEVIAGDFREQVVLQV